MMTNVLELMKALVLRLPDPDGQLEALVTSETQNPTGSGTGSGLPAGGTTGQVPVKLSNANGDVGFATPLAPSSDATISGLWDFTQAPQVNGVPVSTGTGGPTALDSYGVVCKQTPASGDIYASGYVFGTGSAFTLGQTYPIRLTASAAFFLGVWVTVAAAAGGVIRLGVWADDRNGIGPGTLIADLGTVDITTTGLKWSATSVSLSEGTRYWIGALNQGGANGSIYLHTTFLQIAPQVNGSNGKGASSLRITDAGTLPSNPSIVTPDVALTPMIYLKVV